MEAFSALLALCAGNSPVPVNSPHKGQWRGALMLSLICARINDWVYNREAGDLRPHRGHYGVNVMKQCHITLDLNLMLSTAKLCVLISLLDTIDWNFSWWGSIASSVNQKQTGSSIDSFGPHFVERLNSFQQNKSCSWFIILLQPGGLFNGHLTQEITGK